MRTDNPTPNTKKKASRIVSKSIHKILMELKLKKGLSANDIIEQRDSLPEFWNLWESFNAKAMKISDLKTPEGQKYALKNIQQMEKNMFNNTSTGKARKMEAEKIKYAMSIGMKPLEAVNQVISEEVVTDVIMDKDNNEVSRTTQKTIVAKKIERIEFASELTVNTIQSIMFSQEVSDQWLKDYKNAIESSLNGGVYKGKYQFHHLEIAGKFKKMVLDLMDRCQEDLVNGDLEEVRLVQARMKACNEVLVLLNGVKEVEMTPLRILSVAHEGGVNRQKELAGAITNDRTMVDMGNIIIKDEKSVTDRLKLREGLKEQGFHITLQNILTESLKGVGAIEDIEDRIENPIIEVEDESE